MTKSNDDIITITTNVVATHINYTVRTNVSDFIARKTTARTPLLKIRFENQIEFTCGVNEAVDLKEEKVIWRSGTAWLG